ncbi:MAG: lipoate--protein ligase family protein [Rhodopirellula sp.]|nr:lipoate--protein ligase family protein [Rhodopirellula sp.]
MYESAQADNTVLLMVEPVAHSGSWNMATDEYLLEAALSDRLKAVRMYRWEEPTVSLGYFQDSEDEALSTTFQNLATVRRLSGGGAILHHHELTYSFVLSVDDPLTREPTELYNRIHTAIIGVLREYGVDCAMRGEDHAQSDEPFLCFVRGDRHDIHCSGHKVVGSAQRRRKGAVLQHGSILLEHSSHAPQIRGLRDLTNSLRNDAASSARLDQLEVQIGTAIAETLGVVRRIEEWPNKATDRIAELEAARYRSLERTRK